MYVDNKYVGVFFLFFGLNKTLLLEPPFQLKGLKNRKQLLLEQTFFDSTFFSCHFCQNEQTKPALHDCTIILSSWTEILGRQYWNKNLIKSL